MLTFLDRFFFIFHSALIVFILLGWLWRKTRVVNLIVVALTAGSWFILGIWYGIGFCPSTDWHWQVRAKLGYHDMPASYIKFLIDSLSGLDIHARLIHGLTIVLFMAASFASVLTNFRDWKRRR